MSQGKDEIIKRLKDAEKIAVSTLEEAGESKELIAAAITTPLSSSRIIWKILRAEAGDSAKEENAARLEVKKITLAKAGADRRRQ